MKTHGTFSTIADEKLNQNSLKRCSDKENYLYTFLAVDETNLKHLGCRFQVHVDAFNKLATCNRDSRSRLLLNQVICNQTYFFNRLPFSSRWIPICFVFKRYMTVKR